MSMRKASRGQFGTIVIWIVIIAFGLGVFILFTPNLANSFNQSETTNQNQPAVIVNGKEISRTDFNQAFNNLVQNYTRFYQQFNQNFASRLEGAEGAHYQLDLKSQVVDQLVRSELLDQEIEKRGVAAPNDEIETAFKVRFEEILTQNSLTEQQADSILRQQGSSLSQFKGQLREQVTNQLRQDKLKEIVVGPIAASDEDLIAYAQDHRSDFEQKLALDKTQTSSEQAVEAYYQAHQDDYLNVSARHILIKVAEDAPEADVQAAQAKIEDIKRQLDEGADFAELAKEYSEDTSNAGNGGDLGSFGKGQMVAPFEQAAFAMEIGQISDPVKTRFGFHLIKLEGRQVNPLSEVRSQIESALSKERGEQAFSDFIERARGGDADALAKLHEVVKDAYETSQTNDKFEAWFNETKAASNIELKVAEVAAFRLEENDPDAALAAYETLQKAGTSSDRYLDYYIGKLYQKKHDTLTQQLADLKAKDELTEEEKAEQASLDSQIEATRGQAVSHLLASAERQGGNEALYQEIIGMGEDTPSLRYQYAATLLQTNNRSGAIAQLQRALELDANHVQSLQLYGDLMMENFNYAQAADYFKRALDASANDALTARTLRLKLGNAYLGAEQFDNAKNLFQAVLAEDDNNTTALTGLGDLYEKQGDHEQAISYYQKALNISARAEVRTKLGNAYLALNNLDEALSQFEQAQKASPYSVAPYQGLGNVYQARGDNERALEQYREGFLRARNFEERRDIGELVLSLDPNDSTTRFKLADLYKEQHVYQKAIDHYTLVLKQDPNSVAAYWGLAESYEGRVEYDTAKTYYQSALAVTTISEDDRLRTLESILDVEKLIVGFQNAPGLDGLNALIEMAEIHLNRGDTQRAQELLDEAVQDNAEYRQADVAALKERIDGVLANKPGKTVADLGRNHIASSETFTGYNTTPPTSGDHFPTWAKWGIYTVSLRNEIQVHSLEHGGVLIQYKPDLDDAVVQQLVELTRELGPTHRKLILAPYPDLDSNIALTAWTHIDTFDEFDRDRITTFVNEYINKGPEAVNYDGDEWWTKAPYTAADVPSENVMDNGQAGSDGGE